MIVSAIPVNSFQASKFVRLAVKNEANSAEVFNTNSSSFTDCNVVDEEEQKMFDAINEWKYFCHQQILNGNLDVIA